MEMALNMGAFEVLDYSELFAVDGGGIMDVAGAAANIFAAGVGVCQLLAPKVAVCAVIAANPVVAGVGIACAVVGAAWLVYKSLS